MAYAAISPPTNKSSPIPTPPVTTKAPVVFVVDGVLLVIFTTAVEVTVEFNVVVSVTVRVPTIAVLPEEESTVNLSTAEPF